jgi:hypothetical protein
MSVESMLGEEVTLFQRAFDGGGDEYGDPTSASTSVVTHAAMQPMGRFGALEDTNLTDQQSELLQVVLAPDVDPTGYDALQRADGTVYEIVGPPGQVRRPLTGLHHWELHAKAVT